MYATYFVTQTFSNFFFLEAQKKGATPLDKPLFAAETKTNLQTSNVYTAAI
jgi:hypothetical protein